MCLDLSQRERPSIGRPAVADRGSPRTFGRPRVPPAWRRGPSCAPRDPGYSSLRDSTADPNCPWGPALPRQRGNPSPRWLARRRRSSGERLVEDDPVALVVIDHRAPFVGVVVGALHDAAATVLHG